jgi:hypothetical protein
LIADSIPMIADSGSRRRLQGFTRGFCVKLAALDGFFRWFAQGVAVEDEAVRGMDEPVEDGMWLAIRWPLWKTSIVPS